ncbi:hypothetical protein Pint_03718 [Pistacia integerrima]|uniref:Uncharacterized protein n=1 Tax=Pistacia integerrima TaxID=434235 RepID=A0ACC0Z650_9ROSI|nr:hypothetical protein Pint_03718 [Pistacia integerrima]
MAHNFKSSTSTSTTISKSTTKSTTTSRSTTKPTTTTKKIDHGQKHKKIVTSSSAPKAQTSQGTHHHQQVHHHHHHHHHHHQQISKPKAPEKALTQPKPKQAVAHTPATIKSTTAQASIKWGQGVDVKLELDATVVKESFEESILGFIRTCNMLGDYVLCVCVCLYLVN